MKYNLGDSWDGFDGGEYVFDERKEKNFRSGIWKILLCISGLVLIYIAKNHIEEIILVHNGNVIEAQYDAEKYIATYKNDEGVYRTYRLSDYFPAHDGDTIRLYYTNSVNDAIPRNTLSSRLLHYAIFGGLFVMCVWRIRKNR